MILSPTVVNDHIRSPGRGSLFDCILLEHFSLLWSQMSFTAKVTARNLFRNKSRFFMTVTGIAGSCALLLAKQAYAGA